jgi:hypothetical protein
MLHWLNIALGNRKTSLIGVCHALGDRRCAPYAPGAIADRFSRQLDADALPTRLLPVAITGHSCLTQRAR